jgi:hypothetical protein
MAELDPLWAILSDPEKVWQVELSTVQGMRVLPVGHNFRGL